MSLCNCDKRENELIWTGSYFLFKQNKFDSVPTQLNITKNGLHIIQTKSSQCYHMDEVFSCMIMANDDIVDHIVSNGCCRRTANNILENKVSILLTIYNRKSRKLKRKQLLFLINKENGNFHDNLEEANFLKQKLDPLINKGHAINKPILVILNPKSGKGKTIKLFQEKINPMLEDSNIKYQVLTTKYPNHALEFIQNSNDLISTFSGIVTISGDGLLFEVLNGFVNSMEQTRTNKIPIPLSIIPGGSGNGLACSINNIYWNGAKASFSNLIFDCTLHTIKGQPTLMDIVRITTNTSKVYYSFLSFGWGFMADVDIESERLRFLGEQRFAIWSLYRSVAFKKYNGTLSYLPKDNQCDGGDEIHSLDYPVSDSWITINGQFAMVYAAYQKYLNSTVKFAPDSKLDDETIYLLYIKGDVSSCQILQFLLRLEEGLHTKLPFVHFVPVKAFRLIPEGPDDIITVDGEQIPCSAVQAEIIPKMASILLRS